MHLVERYYRFGKRLWDDKGRTLPRIGEAENGNDTWRTDESIHGRRRSGLLPHRLLSADDALGVAWGYSKHDLYNNLDVRAAQLRKKQELYGDASIPFKLGLRGMGIALGSEEIVSDRGENDIGDVF